MEGLHDDGVELPARLGHDLVARDVPVERAAVRAVARHRVERIRHREHACAERRLVGAEPVGVAAAVPALVMGAHNVEALALQERDLGEHLLAEERVLLHARALVGRQRPRLLEDLVGDPDLADVVQEEAVFDASVARDEVGIDHGHELERIAHDALGMIVGAGVLPLECSRERGNRLEIRLLEQRALRSLDREQVPQVLRVEEQLLVLAVPDDAWTRRRQGRAVARQALDDRKQLERAERLVHERLRARALHAACLFGVRAGKEHDRDLACRR